MKPLLLFVATAADVAGVALLRPDVPQLGRTLAHPRAVLAERGADAALLPVVGALGWLVAAWLGVGLGAAVAARLPGVAGRVAGLVAGRLLPRAVLSIVTGSAGVGLLLAPAAAAAPTGDRPPPAWPVTSTSAPTWPTGGRATDPATPHHPAPAGVVTVRPGDSLWAIAAADLGRHATPARIARTWPRWFAANRAVIGADPDRLRPGQVLHAPEPPSTSPSSTPEARR